MALTDVMLPDSEVLEILREHFNINAQISRLPGDVDLNYRIEQDGVPKYVLKISRDDKNEDAIFYQAELLNHLVSLNSGLTIPAFVHSTNDNLVVRYKADDGSIRLIRLLHWISGRLWSQVNPITKNLRASLGHYCGNLVENLSGFDHPYSERFFEWDITQSLWTKEHVHLFSGELKDSITYFQARFEDRFSQYQSLRKSIIHNDANDNNIIVSADLRKPEVSALIDFGDAMKTQVINELAVASTYAIMKTNDPLDASLAVVAGFHHTFPLQEKELSHLYDCIGMRLVISLTKSALNAIQEPDNVYHQISKQDASDLILKWKSISADFAHYAFRSCCDFTAHPKTKEFTAWADPQSCDLSELFPTINKSKVHTIDMSVSSTWLGHEQDYQDLEKLQDKIDKLQSDIPDALIAGGYLEPRTLYSASSYDKLGNYGKTSRTVHLGIDYWLPAYTPVHALFDGEIVTATNDEGEKEYGGLVILKHHENSIEFFTLHGHLTINSATSHSVGDQLKKGDKIGELGPFPENGNWVPHLHFQIILSLLNYKNDFPGVCYPDQTEIWKDLCPDPNLFFKSEGLKAYPIVSEETIKEIRSVHLGKSLSLSYKEPLHIVRGSGVYLIDQLGRKYLDTVNNVAHVGHEHQDVVRAGQNQMAVLNTNTRYMHTAINELALELLETLPKELNVLHFVNSGSEANELALRMAMTVTGNKHILASKWGYHGNTNACIAVSSYKFHRKGGTGKPETTHIFPIPDSFRGMYRGRDSVNCYVDEVEQLLKKLDANNQKPAALILESIISCGGQIELPEGFLPKVYKKVRESGGLCIADEVQTGCGRVGHAWWAFELHDVVPDIVTIGKPLGNGHPVAAVACTRKVADKFANGMEFFNTFGGNPVSCAIASEVIKVVKRENLKQHALETGNYLKQRLEKLSDKYPILANVRGKGLFLGIELTDTDLNPLTQETAYLIDRMKTFGILMSSDGPDNNVLKIKPPMIFSKTHADELLSRLDQILSEDFMIPHSE
ncbi:MAG: aminotransferase class III-fold pyridoxal phosphate-dependent enzyme [Flavobacteriaceae bacterium]|nr:aminotransferase class III-fold pyridoxal phosphate-dependent enzyme [Flavobacteriaceae bacterium]